MDEKIKDILCDLMDIYIYINVLKEEFLDKDFTNCSEHLEYFERERLSKLKPCINILVNLLGYKIKEINSYLKE